MVTLYVSLCYAISVRNIVHHPGACVTIL